MENRTADIIQETRKHIKKKPGSSATQNNAQKPQMHNQMETDLELQLKASRDVRWQLCILVHIQKYFTCGFLLSLFLWR